LRCETKKKYQEKNKAKNAVRAKENKTNHRNEYYSIENGHFPFHRVSSPELFSQYILVKI
jgi:hypothetical protein